MEENRFSCSKDCHLRFSSETQLRIHEKKHEMVLSLGKTTLTTSDQTPTPNTFIRNCEEVGLFQDLKNINPFEETFRKAAEAVRTGATPLYSVSQSCTDDTLHTPQVFPNIIEPDLRSSGVVGCEKVVKQEADTSLKTPIEKLTSGGVQEEQNVQVLLRMPDGTFLQLSTKSLPQAGTDEVPKSASVLNSTVILNTQPLQGLPLAQTPSPTPPPPVYTTSSVKQKLKEALLSSSKASIMAKLKPTLPPITSQDLAMKSNLEKQKPTKKISMSQIRRASSSTNSEEDPNEEKRRMTLERNRAAAMRCRQRRKAWVADLSRKADLMTATNHSLVQEVSALRAEVVRLKALLLTHKDCPVTLAAQGQIVDVEEGRKCVSTLENLVIVGGKKTVEEATTSLLLARKKKKLSLDIEQARCQLQGAGSIVDPDSPVIRSDEVLSSVAPTTPNDTTVTFADEIDNTVNEMECLEERTPVIQLNPNVVLRTSTHLPSYT